MASMAESILISCFRKTSDIFITVSFEKQKTLLFTEDAKHVKRAPGYLSYERYADGVSQDSESFFGTWIQYPYVSMSASFASEPDEKDKKRGAVISDSEIAISYSFENVGGTRTDYSFQIRRSTLRFVETFLFNNMQTHETGYCKQF